MLHDIIDVLADPADGTALRGEDDYARLVSESGHSYDVARQGYVSLLTGAGSKHSGDSAEMVASREAFLSRGYFAPFVEAVSERVATAVDDMGSDTPTILEVGAGTGYYLAHTLDAIDGSRGVGLDLSTAAAKHLAKAHPRIGSVVADIWQSVPLRDDSVDVISVVFSPRNPAEFARILRPGGQVVVVTPSVGHLDELREPLGIIGVEEGKMERMIAQAAGYLAVVGEPESLTYTMDLDREAIAAQVGMSPSARHIEDLPQRVAALPSTMTVTAAANVTTFELDPVVSR